MIALAQKLADLAELEQAEAMRAEARGTVVALGERDRHIARAGAFLEAARLALPLRRKSRK